MPAMTKEEEGEEQALVLALTTEASREQAEALALALLERRLVACVSLLPVQSHYRWQGKLESAREVQLLLKTRADLLEELRVALLALHSYDTPEWIHWRATTAGAYGAWCIEQLAGS